MAADDRRMLGSAAMKKLGNELRTLRKQQGYTIDEIAKMVDISAKTLARIEKAESSVTVSKLFALADVLGVSPDEMLRHAVQTTASHEADWPEEALRDLEFAREFIRAKYKIV